jgi:hypothetical protein
MIPENVTMHFFGREIFEPQPIAVALIYGASQFCIFLLSRCPSVPTDTKNGCNPNLGIAAILDEISLFGQNLARSPIV